jgi:hypothetical protein
MNVSASTIMIAVTIRFLALQAMTMATNAAIPAEAATSM